MIGFDIRQSHAQRSFSFSSIQQTHPQLQVFVVVLVASKSSHISLFFLSRRCCCFLRFFPFFFVDAFLSFS